MSGSTIREADATGMLGVSGPRLLSVEGFFAVRDNDDLRTAKIEHFLAIPVFSAMM